MMGDPDKKEEERSRIPYVKPRLEQVELKPEEVVLANCNTASIKGPKGSASP
jgi:hypothetical protein